MFSSKFLEYEIGIQTANKYSFLKRFLLQQNHPSAIECCGLSHFFVIEINNLIFQINTLLK